MGKLDQKQKVQVVVLAVLAVGLFGTFIFQMLKVTPAAAKTQDASAAPAANSATAALKFAGTSAADAVIADAPPPTDTMRDPFVPGIVDDATIKAYQTAQKATAPPHQASGRWNAPAPPPFVSPLPRPGDGFSLPTARNADLTVTPLPKPADATPNPAWTVTGVVGGDEGRMAILREGDARRMVRTGDMVDDVYRVVDVDASGVTLAHGKSRYTLPIGATPAAPPAPPAITTSMSTPQANAPQDLGAPADGTDTGVPAGTVTPGGTQINPNALIKLPGGLTLPTVHLPAN